VNACRNKAIEELCYVGRVHQISSQSQTLKKKIEKGRKKKKKQGEEFAVTFDLLEQLWEIYEEITNLKT